MTPAQLLQHSFAAFFEAPLAAWAYFAGFCEEVSFKKDEVIKQAGKLEQYGYFIIEGSAGVFLWKENQDVCLELVLAPNFFGDEMSLNTNAATPLETRAIEPVRALRINKANLMQLKSTPIGMQIFLIAAEQGLVIKQKQQIDLLMKTAQQRYEEMLDTQAELIGRIPQKYIASYLGITTQSLSRIRKLIYKK
jgi:CRP/FNR family transcriptional regulator, anaerobic regulatory protein